ncbi:hypothetical protein DRF69_11065 [Chryseobacterium sp. 5_R23647]|nr:hypothetical protein DRF69_11065 [Chryseobacterium sp. 5_R23647]
MANPFQLNLPYGAGKIAVWRVVKKMLKRWQSGQRESDGISVFFAARNTAMCGAEVHILPLNFPLKKSSIWTAGTWAFCDELFN